jgi:hypothetical protein
MTVRTNTKLLFIIISGLLLLTSCGATAIDLSKFKNCSALASYDRKRITLEGYFSASQRHETLGCDKNAVPNTCIFDFALQASTGSEIASEVKVGNAPNHLKDLPVGDIRNLDSDNRTKVVAGLKFLTHDGQVVSTGDRVRITGTFVSQFCLVEVEKIEKL